MSTGTLAAIEGIPAADVIDPINGPLNLYWHARSDTVDKCSPVSLGVDGDTVFKTLDALEASGTLLDLQPIKAARPTLGLCLGQSRFFW